MKTSKYLLVFLSVCLLTLWVLFLFRNQNINQTPNTYAWDFKVEWDLRISPYGIEDKLIDWILKTDDSLKMRMYTFSSKEIERLFKNLSFLGIDITWIGERFPYWWFDPSFDKLSDRLKANNIEVLTDDHLWINFNHTKVILRDDNEYLISTANLSYSSFWNNREYWFIWNQPTIAKSISILFEKDKIWKSISKTDIHDKLLVCPIDCREKIEYLILQAEESISISAQYLQDESLIRLLEWKINSISLKILLWSSQEFNTILDSQLHSQTKILHEPYLHSKNILIDWDVLIMWSMNLSDNALDNNREIWIIIEDKEVIKDFLHQFNRDWTNWKSIQ